MTTPYDTVKALLSIQADAVNQSVELQKKATAELTAFFKVEVEKAKELKTPEQVLQYNIEANDALMMIMKSQSAAYAEIAEKAQQAALAEVKAITH